MGSARSLHTLEDNLHSALVHGHRLLTGEVPPAATDYPDGFWLMLGGLVLAVAGLAVLVFLTLTGQQHLNGPPSHHGDDHSDGDPNDAQQGPSSR